MKFFIVFATLVAAASAVPYAGLVNTGASAVSRSDDGYGNYAFGYNEDHATGGTFRKEKGGPGYQSGSYGLRDADGRMRVVNYVADAHGFRASVQTNEPGTDPKQDPAATSLTGSHAGVVAGPALAAAPLHAAPLLAAPLHAAPVHAAPLYAAPVAHGLPIASSYSVSTQHASLAAPLAAPLAGYGYAKAGYGLPGHY
ncbi:hypothetical protein DERP_002889 [Dermatophagoides pteronyssinus]|uniref:Cuticle protein 14-like n=1 Tax=Dermatophagoides pteronyssinus TaxID=6956 RepID=A0ABQ8JVX9_DERPT|nr:hypothetical protein DERP_002889 [Dermatophagoides pteronyssinus]